MLRTITHPVEGKAPVYDPLGVRLRGLEMTRLETFVDASFAFSVTMLALSPDRIPTSFQEMYDLLRGIPAFLFSLGILMLFWNSHVVFSRRFGLEDRPIKLLSVLYIAAMLIYVYPLKFMSTAFFGYYFPILRTPDFLKAGTSNDLASIFIAMAAGFVVISILNALMYVHAHRRRRELALTEHERRVSRCEITNSLLYAGIGVLSILLAIVFRNRMAVISAGFVYALLGVVIPVYWVRFGPTNEQIRDATGG